MKNSRTFFLFITFVVLWSQAVLAEENKTEQTSVEEKAEVFELKSKISKLESENKKLLKDFRRAIDGLKELKAAKEKVLKESAEQKQKNSTQAQDNEKLKEERTQLQQEVVRLQNELLLRETEIKVLSGDPAAKKELEKIRVEEKKVTTTGATQQREEVASDITIVEVIADKVNIRSGAGREHSPIMQVQRGTRLTVEAKEGAWYRVFTPTGSRGYIQVNVVRQAQAKVPAKKVANIGEASQGSSDNMVPFEDDSGSKDKDNGMERRALDRLRSNFR